MSEINFIKLLMLKLDHQPRAFLDSLPRTTMYQSRL
jgi:hypothetical protein